MTTFSTIGQEIRRLGTLAADLMLPPQCLLCGEPTATARSACPGCWYDLTIIDAPLCDRLGIPFAYDPGPGALSALALAKPPKFARARAAVAFDEASRKVIHAAKYGDRHETFDLMSRMMARAGRQLLSDCDMIVPVPLHWKRLWGRRYNQSAILAKRISGSSGKRFAPSLLVRTKATRSQTSLDDRARRRNVRKAFAVPAGRREAIAGRRILLIDDVLTTGATTDACAEVCLKAGAAAVDVLVFALVFDPARLHI